VRRGPDVGVMDPRCLGASVCRGQREERASG